MRIACICVFFLLTTGCATKFDANPNYASPYMADNLSRDKEYCEQMARGHTPPPPVDFSYIPDQKINYKGTVADGYRSYQYQGAASVDNSYARASQGMQNLGFALGYAFAVTSRENKCMQALGWKKQAELTDLDNKRVAFNDIWVTLYNSHKGDPDRDLIFYAMALFVSDLSATKKEETYTATIQSNGQNIEKVYSGLKAEAIKEDEALKKSRR